ncbi:30S ribosomal protein S13 [Candidatus Margulisiibacteriota bacterium]
MVRLAGRDLPLQKTIWIGLTSIYGIGRSTSSKILAQAGVNPSIRVKDMTEDQVVAIRDVLGNYVLEGDLRRDVMVNIKRLRDIGSYRGMRHRANLPVRGQRTKTNARTKRPKKLPVAAKKTI